MVRGMAEESESDDELLVGKPLGDYQLLALLGTGTSAHVYRGEKTRERNTVFRAIKVIHKDQTRKLKGRFSEEERLLEDLRHDNIVRFFKAGNNDGYLWMELELLEGKTLRVLLDEYRSRNECPPIKRMIEILLHAARGVAFAHEYKNGVVHRDIKPDNIFVVENGNAKVLDFGIARALDDADRENVTMTGVGPPGSAPYMPPESWEKKRPTRASDVYSLGITLMEAIAGIHPFEEPGQGKPSAMACMKAHAEGKIKPLRQLRPDAPKSLEKVAAKATAKKPEQRYVSAKEFVEALESVLGDVRAKDETRYRSNGPSPIVPFFVVLLFLLAGLFLPIIVLSIIKKLGLGLVDAAPPSSTAIASTSLPMPDPSSLSNVMPSPPKREAGAPMPSPSASITASSVASGSTVGPVPKEEIPLCWEREALLICSTPLVKVKEYDACVKAGTCDKLVGIYGKDGVNIFTLFGESNCTPPNDAEKPLTCISFLFAEKYCAFRGGRLPNPQEPTVDSNYIMERITTEWRKAEGTSRTTSVWGIAPTSKQFYFTGVGMFTPIRQQFVGASYLGFRCAVPMNTIGNASEHRDSN
jgi:serine/threonine protein kinase